MKIFVSIFRGEFVVFEGLNVKVWLKDFRRLATRNFLQSMKHGSLYTNKMQVCIFNFKEFLVHLLLLKIVHLHCGPFVCPSVLFYHIIVLCHKTPTYICI